MFEDFNRKIKKLKYNYYSTHGRFAHGSSGFGRNDEFTYEFLYNDKNELIEEITTINTDNGKKVIVKKVFSNSRIIKEETNVRSSIDASARHYLTEYEYFGILIIITKKLIRVDYTQEELDHMYSSTEWYEPPPNISRSRNSIIYRKSIYKDVNDQIQKINYEDFETPSNSYIKTFKVNELVTVEEKIQNQELLYRKEISKYGDRLSIEVTTNFKDDRVFCVGKKLYFENNIKTKDCDDLSKNLLSLDIKFNLYVKDKDKDYSLRDLSVKLILDQEKHYDEIIINTDRKYNIDNHKLNKIQNAIIDNKTNTINIRKFLVYLKKSLKKNPHKYELNLSPYYFNFEINSMHKNHAGIKIPDFEIYGGNTFGIDHFNELLKVIDINNFWDDNKYLDFLWYFESDFCLYNFIYLNDCDAFLNDSIHQNKNIRNYLRVNQETKCGSMSIAFYDDN